MKTNAIVKIISVFLFGLMAWSSSAYATDTICVSNTVIDKIYFNGWSSDTTIDGRANITMKFDSNQYRISFNKDWLNARDWDSADYTYESLVRAATAAYLAGTPVTLKSYHDDCSYKVNQIILEDS